MFEIEDAEKYWLAGLLEGEGSFMKGPPSSPSQSCISLHMTDEDIIAKVALIFKVKYHATKQACNHHKVAYRVTKKGSGAIKIMKEIMPLMGYRRQMQIKEAVKAYEFNVKKHKLSAKNVADIKVRLDKNEKHKDIAKIYDVDRTTISHIKSGRIYSNNNLLDE